jgi:adenosylhomocysteine nucleosidase
MEREIAFLRGEMTPPDLSRDKFVVGTIFSKAVLLLRTGVGPQKTARRLEEIEEAHNPQCVLSIGCAGALSPDIGTGDVVISERLIDDAAGGRAYHPSPALVETAKDCCKRLGLPFHVGGTASTPSVVATTRDKKDLAAKYGAVAVDMESAQVAAWADKIGIPMLSVRTISDSSADRIPPEIAAIVDRDGRMRLLKTFAFCVGRPRLFLELLRLKSGFDRSIGILEKVVMTLLRSL